MSNFYYYVTSKPASVVSNAVRLVDRLHRSPDRKEKPYLVLSRSSVLDFYEGISEAEHDSLHNVALQATPTFSVNLHTGIEKMIHWAPPIPTFSVSSTLDPCGNDQRKHLKRDPDDGPDSYQEGLLLLTERLSLYLLIPDYEAHTVRVISSLELDDSKGYRNDQEPLLAIDSNYYFLCVQVHKMALQLIRLQRRLHNSGVKNAWKLRPPVTLRLPNIYPISIIFATRTYSVTLEGELTSSDKSPVQQTTLMTRHPHRCGASESSSTPSPFGFKGIRQGIKRSKPGTASPSIPSDSVPATNSPLYNVYDSERHVTFLSVLYEASLPEIGPGDHVSRFICHVDMQLLATRDFQETLWKKHSYHVNGTADKIVNVPGGLCVFSGIEVVVYGLQKTSQLTRIVTATLPESQRLQCPLEVVPIDASKRRWLVGDASGSLLLVSLELAEGRCLVSSTPPISRISFAWLGQFSPVSCLALFDRDIEAFPNTRRLDREECSAKDSSDSVVTSSSSHGFAVRRPLLIFLGSITGDSLILQLYMSQKGVVLGSEYVTVAQHIPNLGPIVDFTHWSGFQGTQNHLILASGYSKTGSLRLISEGVAVVPVLKTSSPLATTACRLAVATQGPATCPRAILLFEESPFSSRILALRSDTSASPKLKLDLFPCPSSLPLSTDDKTLCLFVGNVYEYSVIVHVTAATIRLVDDTSLSLLGRFESGTVLTHGLKRQPRREILCDIAIGDGRYLALGYGQSVIVLELTSRTGDYACVGQIYLEDDIQSMDIVAPSGLVFIADWSGSIYLYHLTTMCHSKLSGNMAATNSARCVFKRQLRSSSGTLMVPSAVSLVFLDSSSVSTYRSAITSLCAEACPTLVACVGFLYGGLLCLRLAEQEDTGMYVVQDEQPFSVGKTPVILRKMCRSAGDVKRSHLCCGLIALCDTPMVLFPNRVARLQTTPLGLTRTVDAVVWDLALCGALLHAALPHHPSSGSNRSTPTVPLCPPSPSFMIASLSSVSGHALKGAELYLGVTNGIQKLQMKTIPLRVSPERVVFHESSGLIVAAAVDEPFDVGSRTKNHKARGCLFLVDPKTEYLYRHYLGVREYPSALLSCRVGTEQREVVILASVLGPRASRGQIKVYDVTTPNDLAPNTNATDELLPSSSVIAVDGSDTPLHLPAPLEQLCCDQLEAVSALAQVDNVLVAACPNKIKLFYILVDSRSTKEGTPNITLSCVSMYSAHCYVHTLDTFRSCILMGHVSRSVGVYSLRKTNTLFRTGSSHTVDVSLDEVAIDCNPAWSTAACFCASATRLLMADDSKSIVALAQCRGNIPSGASTLSTPRQRPLEPDFADDVELKHVGRFHTGESIHRLLTVSSPSLLRSTKKKNSVSKSQMDDYDTSHSSCSFISTFNTKWQTFWSSTQGGLGVIFELPEDCYRHLLKIQKALYQVLPSPLGIDLSTARDFVSAPRRIPHHGFIDGDIVETFLDLPFDKQLTVFDALHKSHPNDFPDFQALLRELEELHRSHI